MNDIFATLYETWLGIYSYDYPVIFNHIYENGQYIWLGLAFLLIPIPFWAVFYLLWRYPYGKFLHWFIWMVLSIITVAGTTYSIMNMAIFASNDQSLISALSNPASGYDSYANTLIITYAFYNSGLAVIAGFFYSLILKQFSKIQIHLPF